MSLTQSEAWALVELGRSVNVRVAFWDVSSKFDREHLCPWPFERAVVTSDMRTVPCCMIGDPDQFEIGHGENFRTLWEGEEYQRFRQAHLDYEIPEVCRACYRKE